MIFLLPVAVLLFAGCTLIKQPTSKYSIESREENNAEIDKLTLLLKKTKWPAEITAYRYMRGRSYWQANRPEEAMQDIIVADKVSGAKPENGFMAELHEELSEPENTLPKLELAIEQRKPSKYTDYVWERAIIGALLQKYQQAERDLDELLGGAFSSREAELQTLKAFCLYKTGRSKEACRYLEQALALEPERTQALLLKARILLDESRLEEALQCSNDARSILKKVDFDRYLSVGASEPVRLRGAIYAQMNKPVRALADFRMAELIDNQKGIESFSRLSAAERLANAGSTAPALELLNVEINSLEQKLAKAKSLAKSLKKQD
jgi:tetratricopeptide (TPR) repeat protein